LDIKIATDLDQTRWDLFLKRQSHPSPYLLFAWGRAVEAAYGHRIFYLIAAIQDEVVGIFPLVYMKPLWGAGQMVSLPYCDLGGRFSHDAETEEALVAKAISLARALSAGFLELRTWVPTLSLREEEGRSVHTKSHKVSMILDLPDSSEAVWKKFKSKLRSQIRKAEKNGCSFSWGGLEELDLFYQVFSLNMRDLGSPVHSKKWIQSILEYYGPDARMGLVHFDGKPIGAGIILSVGTVISIPWASTLRSHNHLSPNMMLYWNFIKYAADNGYTQFDLGRSSPNEGTYRFKAQWGAKPVPLYWHTISLAGNEGENEAERSFARGIAEKLWQKLPLFIANGIGPRLRKHISL